MCREFQSAMQPFLKISTRCHDALVFVGKLASSTNALTVEDAATAPLSASYLEQIAISLKDAGLIVGKRGPGGGYRLARPATAITVKDVVEAVEGPLALVPCLSEKEQCVASSACASQSLWRTLQNRISETLSETTVASLVK